MLFLAAIDFVLKLTVCFTFGYLLFMSLLPGFVIVVFDVCFCLCFRFILLVGVC